MTAGISLGSVLGLALGLIYGLAAGLVSGLALGLASGLITGVPLAINVPPSKEAHPWELLRDDLVVGLTLALVDGLTLGLAAGLASGLMTGLALGLGAGLMAGLACGLTSGVVRRYAVFLLCSRNQLPFRLVRFLDWACEAGLLRYSGPAYQFRHRELQRWLADHPDPVHTALHP
ncbi:hypothetical protein ACWD4F_30995 [Streptomyces aureus]